MKFKSTKGLSEKKLLKDYPLYYKEMNNFIKEEEIPLSEKIWLYQNGLKEIPSCLNCDKKVKFIKFYKGYRKYCSRKCSAKHTHKDEEVRKKRVDKMLACNFDKETRNIMTLKSNETKANFSLERINNINNKRSHTVNKKWGVDNISKNPLIKEKMSKKLIEVLPKIHQDKNIKRISELGFKVLSIKNNKFELLCSKCNKKFTISNTLFNQRNRFNIEPCLNCNPNNNNSFFELSIYEFIKDNYKGQIKRGYRGLKKYEIDIYLPELNIGFECNGLWWHSERYKENNYHKEKSDFFLEKGIQIIHIWEDDWNFKKDITKSRILNLSNTNSYKVWARKCEIKEIESKVYKDFTNNNHLQGYAPAKVKIGLYHNDELISVMSFSNLRRNLGYKNKKEGEYELLRFCSKKNTINVGGSSKMLSYFIKTYKPLKIISYASRDWSVGNLYEKIGFVKIKETDPNYFYAHKDEGIRINRFNFRKDVLVKEGYDKNKTEHQIMNSRGYNRVYDSGSILYEFKG